MSAGKPGTLGALRASGYASRPVKQELRENLAVRLRNGGPIFPGVVGYERSVIPGIVNALLAQHDFILLGLRGQAKTRLLRALVTLLDEDDMGRPARDRKSRVTFAGRAAYERSRSWERISRLRGWTYTRDRSVWRC